MPENPEELRLRAHQLRQQGRLDAASATMHALGMRVMGDPDKVADCALFIKECSRHALAAELCEKQIERGPITARLLAQTGSVDHELGRFASARKRYLAAMQAGIDLNHWFLPFALSGTQRYADTTHPDFDLFRSHLSDSGLSPRARASICFALGKACDDVGDTQQAAGLFREANALVRSGLNWSRSAWDAFVDAQVADAFPGALSVPTGGAPVFVVGMVRSGTTLLAERLATHPGVRNRGELPFMPYLASQLKAQGMLHQPHAWMQAREIYLPHLFQDDAPARWYIDKHPLNFRYLGLMAAMFPDARVVYCRRDPRDNALSIYSQYFAHADNDYAYDFGDIASYAHGCDRLMTHWMQTLRLPIHVVDYEDMVSQSAATLSGLHEFLGLSEEGQVHGTDESAGVIASASMWQARQPIYQRSAGRWERYAPWLPELQELFGSHQSGG